MGKRLYNIFSYILNTKGVDLMTFESIFDKYKPQYSVSLTAERHPSLSLVEKEPFYVKPQLNNISLHRDSKIIVISAPGATGKSALARYLAYKYSSIYWDLSQTTVGDMTFLGEIVSSIGVENYSEYIKNLLAGETFLIIDAFDEAEMISGPKAVKNFLLEVHKQIERASNPCVILLSRTETAQNICATYLEAGVDVNHYEISFFEDTASKEFVYQKVQQIQTEKQIKKSDPGIVRDCIADYLRNIERLVPENEKGSFIGYAPVLEVIGEDIAQEQNAYKFWAELRQENEPKGIDVVAKILEQLITREHDKVCNAFQEKISDRMTEVNHVDYSSLYSKFEQLTSIINYIVFGEVDFDAYDISYIPSEFLDDYIEVIKTFLPQHPFVRSSSSKGTEFAGPAFRDFTLAELMLKGTQDEVIQCYFAEKKISEHFPSHLLWKFFTMDEPEEIDADKVSCLFESFKSQVRQPYVAQLSIVGDKDSEYMSTWSLSTPKDRGSFEVDSYKLNINEKGIIIDNLVNTFIDVDCSVTLKNDSRSVRISNGTVISKVFEVQADQLILDAHAETPCIIVSRENAKFVNSSSGNTEIIVNGSNVQIDIPNYKFVYCLAKYQSIFSEESDFTIELFVYLLRKIFVQFRKHRKDTPARDAEKIDYIIIGQNLHRQTIFSFLKDRGIVYQDGDTHLYKINMQKLEEAGISYGALTRGDTKQLKEAYDIFTDWNSKKIH